jgi:transposase
MVIIGADLHKRTHTVVAVDELGRKLAERTVTANQAGHLELLRWAARFPVRRFALEDCRHLSRRLEADLLRSGEAVVRVSPKLMAGARRAGRERGKSDPIDALAVARAALREPDLPIARLDGPEREVRLLVDHREDLVRTRVEIENRLRWHLHELMPGEEPAPRSLGKTHVLDDLERRLAALAGLVARIARDLVVRIRDLTLAISSLERELAGRVAPLAPALLSQRGCGVLLAAKIVGETGGIERFRTRAAFARFNGTAPVPVWSGNVERFRLNSGGNRQLNAALHRMAIALLAHPSEGRAYLERRLAAGDTKREAIRALKRRLSDIVFRCLRQDASSTPVPNPARLEAAA